MKRSHRLLNQSRILVGTLFSLVILTHSADAQVCTNLIQNPSFELGPLQDGIHQYSPEAIPGWSLLSERTKGNKPPKIEVRKNVKRKATDGVAFLELDTLARVIDEVYQDVLTVPGNLYRLTLDIKPRNRVYSASTNRFYVVINGRAEAVFRPTKSNRPNGWNTQSLEFVAKVPTSRISFREIAAGLYGGGDGRSPSIDNVQLCNMGLAPEPNPNARVAGPPTDMLELPEIDRGGVTRKWKHLESTIKWRSTGIKTEEFLGVEFDEHYLDLDTTNLETACRSFLTENANDFELQGIEQYLTESDESNSLEHTATLRQLYQGKKTLREFVCQFEKARQLYGVSSTLRKISSQPLLIYPENYEGAIAAAKTFVGAMDIPTDTIFHFEREWAYVDPNGIPHAIVEVTMLHPRILYQVQVRVPDNIPVWASDLTGVLAARLIETQGQ